MKFLKLFLLTALLGFGLCSYAMAETATFTIQAQVPQATSVAFTTSRVDLGTKQFTLLGKGNQVLDFGLLKFDSVTGTFLPNYFYAIDVGAVDSAGNPAAGAVNDVSLTYTGESSPSGATAGLGVHSTVTYSKVTGATGSQIETVFNRKLLADVNAAPALSANFAGGFLRLYVGIYTGEVFTDFPLPAKGKPFTPTDVPGLYSGTLTLSATMKL